MEARGVVFVAFLAVLGGSMYWNTAKQSGSSEQLTQGSDDSDSVSEWTNGVKYVASTMPSLSVRTPRNYAARHRTRQGGFYVRVHAGPKLYDRMDFTSPVARQTVRNGQLTASPTSDPNWLGVKLDNDTQAFLPRSGDLDLRSNDELVIQEAGELGHAIPAASLESSGSESGSASASGREQDRTAVLSAIDGLKSSFDDVDTAYTSLRTEIEKFNVEGVTWGSVHAAISSSFEREVNATNILASSLDRLRALRTSLTTVESSTVNGMITSFEDLTDHIVTLKNAIAGIETSSTWSDAGEGLRAKSDALGASLESYRGFLNRF